MSTGELEIAEWIAFDKQHPAPTFFARPAWALALSDAFPQLKPSALWVERGGARYLLPTVRTKTRAPLREHIAFPMGGYSCVLDEKGRAADPATARLVLGELAGRVDRLNFIPWPLAIPESSGARVNARYETAVIDCSSGYESAIGNVRGVTRRMAGQAQRRGVICERGGLERMDEYHGILQNASHGWGLDEPTISRKLLDAVFARGGDDAQLWFARVDDEVAGGGVILYGSEELFFWSAAMRRELARYRPSNALNFALIAQACERGVHWYNLGASEGLEGVARFKHDLGAVTIPYEDWSFERTRYALYQRARSYFITSARSAP